jgi:hypothetical protein
MKCPRCGEEMTLDSHRKYPLYMCYNCGYMEGRNMEEAPMESNYAHLRGLNLNEAAAFLSEGFGLSKEAVVKWLMDPAE